MWPLVPITTTVKKSKSLHLSTMNHFTSNHSEWLRLWLNYAEIWKNRWNSIFTCVRITWLQQPHSCKWIFTLSFSELPIYITPNFIAFLGMKRKSHNDTLVVVARILWWVNMVAGDDHKILAEKGLMIRAFDCVRLCKVNGRSWCAWCADFDGAASRHRHWGSFEDFCHRGREQAALYIQQRI